MNNDASPAVTEKVKEEVRLKSTLKIPSLKTLQSSVQTPVFTTEKKEKQELIVRNEAFTRDQVIAAWQEYTLKFKEEGKKSESIILNRHLEFTDDFTIQIKLDNFVQMDLLNTFKPDLLNFIRSKINNSALNLIAEISEEETVKLIYTSNDKFKYLAEKYPILGEMKKRFGLDTDF